MVRSLKEEFKPKKVIFVNTTKMGKSFEGSGKYGMGGNIEIGDKVKATKAYGGKSGVVIDKRGSFIIVKDNKGETESYHESDLIKRMKMGGGLDDKEVKFIEYKDQEIMYEPTNDKYYTNDEEFDTLKQAQNYIDDGSQMSSKTINAYRKGAFKDGGDIKEQMDYSKTDTSILKDMGIKLLKDGSKESMKMAYDIMQELQKRK
jgi:hypothetical protein